MRKAVVIAAALAIAAIVIAFVFPTLITIWQRMRQMETIANLGSVGDGILLYGKDHNHYPNVRDVNALALELTPIYMSSVHTRDAWGHLIRYECWSSDGKQIDSFAIASAGRDGVFTHRSLREYQGRTRTTNFDDDIIFGKDRWIQYPRGLP